MISITTVLLYLLLRLHVVASIGALHLAQGALRVGRRQGPSIRLLDLRVLNPTPNSNASTWNHVCVLTRLIHTGWSAESKAVERCECLVTSTAQHVQFIEDRMVTIHSVLPEAVDGIPFRVLNSH